MLKRMGKKIFTIFRLKILLIKKWIILITETKPLDVYILTLPLVLFIAFKFMLTLNKQWMRIITETVPISSI